MKWEYAVVDLSVFDNVDKRLNTMGSSNWELVSVDAGVAYFKRPVENEELNASELGQKLRESLPSSEPYSLSTNAWRGLK